MEKQELYYWLMMFSLTVMAVWVILKAVGIIQTPVWVQMIPYASAIFFAGTLTQSFRMTQFDVSTLKDEMRDVRERIVRVEERAKHTDKDIHQLKGHVDKEFQQVHSLLAK